MRRCTWSSRRATGRPIPDSVDARIALVPSATETLGHLFAAMRDAHSRAIVVDLRRNGGGNSAISAIVAYFLYPIERLLETDGGYQIPRFSKLYFDNYRTNSVPKVRAERWSLFELGDEDFSEERAWRDAKGRALDAATRATRLKSFDDAAAAMPTFDAERRAGSANAGWQGQVVVGVPSAQTGNCFIDGLPFRLAHSGLQGSISYKQSFTFPDDPVRGELLLPDVALTYDTLAAHDFDPNASIVLALEMIARAQAP